MPWITPHLEWAASKWGEKSDEIVNCAQRVDVSRRRDEATKKMKRFFVSCISSAERFCLSRWARRPIKSGDRKSLNWFMLFCSDSIHFFSLPALHRLRHEHGRENFQFKWVTHHDFSLESSEGSLSGRASTCKANNNKSIRATTPPFIRSVCMPFVTLTIPQNKLKIVSAEEIYFIYFGWMCRPLMRRS